MPDVIYEQLREKIDEYSVGFNKTDSGVEIKILKRIFTPEEAKMYMNLSKKLETVDVIAERGGYDIDTATEMLFEMSYKGHMFPLKKNDVQYYAAAPFMHGIFEHQAYTIDKELAEMFEQYMAEFQPRGFATRTIPVNTEVTESILVAPYDDVRKIIMSKERIGLFQCACASKAKAMETGCDKPLEVCMGFDFYAEYPISMGVGRWITHEEALKILDETEEAGLIHQSLGDSENVEALCNCCGDCCMALKMIKAFPQPALLSGSNYQASLADGECTLCEDCTERCPMDAISAGDDSMGIDLDRCIGCGLCVTACPADAITLMSKPEEMLQGPPSPEEYTFMRPSRDFEADIAGKN